MHLARLLDSRTILTMSSTLVIALFFAWPREHFDSIIIYLPYRLLLVGDMLFHEMGHAVFHWIFGFPAVPGIMTLFGSEIAPGYTLYFNHSWLLQLLVWAAMAYGAWWLRRERPAFFWPFVILCLVTVPLSFSRYIPDVIGGYMGHGASILCSGVLLYRAWLNVVVKTAWERWLNALFGFFILFHNIFFSWMLGHSANFKDSYQSQELAEDFVQMVDMMPRGTIDGIATFTLFYGALTLLFSFALAAYFYEDEHYSDG